MPDAPEQEAGSPDEADERRGKLSGAAKRLDNEPRLLKAAKFARQLLPGDSRFGDPLSTAGKKAPHVVGRRLSLLTAERPGVSRELGLGALQVWQAMSEAQGRGRGDEDLAILFTDLANFSDWALEAGDELALELLRDVGEALEPCIDAHDGEVVKRLGDGLMAVFPSADSALEATLQGRERLLEVEVAGHKPCIRAGIHVGRPRRLGGDYLGVDVNIAARLIGEASPDEVLISDKALEDIDDGRYETKRRWRFKAKGAPAEMTAFAVRLASR